MKRIYLLSLLFTFLMGKNMHGQGKLIDKSTHFPTDYGTYTFPLGSKIVIELKDNNKNQLEYRVLKVEPIEGFYSFEKSQNILSDSPQKNTIELFFMGAYFRDGKEDKDYKTMLLLRNNSDTALNYKAEIKYYYSDKYENTSVTPLMKNTRVREIWGHKIDNITLSNFEKYKL